MVAKSFKLYLYLELTVPQVSDCSPLGRLVCVILDSEWQAMEHCNVMDVLYNLYVFYT